MGKLIVPRHTADLEYILPAMQVYYDENDWVKTDVYKDKLFDLLKSSGKEKSRNTDETHYTKCSEIPRYFGFLERKEPGKAQSDVRITESGKRFYESIKNKDFQIAHEIIFNALENISFGRNNEGCGSDTNVEAPNVLIVSMILLNGISNKDAAYILGEVNDKGCDVVSAILRIEYYRKKGEKTPQPTVTTDIKFIPFLKRIGFFCENEEKLTIVSQDIIDRYGEKISKLPLINHDEVRFTLQEEYSKKAVDNNIIHAGFSLLTALRTKPFLLLAGISGTGKSRFVRELAKSCWKADEENTDFGNNCPRNFCMVQVKPNWHDSSELMGYVSRIGEKPVFVTGEFLKFITKAWKEPDKPYFLCLDEMNLAPVEQYFAEYLSVIESRKRNNDGSITTDPILKKEAEEWYHTLISNLTEEETLREKFLEEGIALPQNLFVIGTVNMDETTFSFSRKVLDRAMTIEMNEVDLNGGLDENAPSEFGYIGDWLKCVDVEGKDVYADNKDLCDKVITYLEGVNAVLEGTPFKIAYRTRNEFLIYAVHRGEDNLANALDEMTSMKILSRIEGDADKIGNLLDRLESVIRPQVQEENPDDEHPAVMSVSLKKLDEMKKKLSSGYTSFWS